jgi:GT2 family glycosyltransferase
MSNKIFLCSLTHDGKLDHRMAGVFFTAATKQQAQCDIYVKPSSLLAATCNEFWAKAQNDGGYEWFAMLHADIVPEPGYLDKLIALAEEHQADIMSAVVPIKGPAGSTSTAISGKDVFTRTTRLMTRQLYNPAFPKTFDIEAACKGLNNLGYEIFDPGYLGVPVYLLINTGCMVVRLKRPWCKFAWFSMHDTIVEGPGGMISNLVESEDWFFARTAAEAGARVMATTEIHLEHLGTMSYHSHSMWGADLDPIGYVSKMNP